MVDIKNITLLRNEKIIIKNGTITLSKGSITCLIGESGSGKTTLLKALAGLIPIERGTITIDNKNINSYVPRERSINIGYVFQQFNLFPHLTVLENCIHPQLIHGINYNNAENTARLTLTDLGMIDYINQYSSQLSGGQQQRVALARALCLAPKILLLDEPTASLDPSNTKNLIAILQKLSKQGITILISSQDIFFINILQCTLILLKNEELITIAASEQNIHESPFNYFE